MEFKGCPIQRNDLLAVAAGAEMLLYDGSVDAVHVLNASAWFVWQQCNGQRSPEDIVSNLKMSYANTQTYNVVADVLNTLDTLKKANLVTIAD